MCLSFSLAARRNLSVALGWLSVAGVLGAAGPVYHARCQPLPTNLLGPFVRLDDRRILAIDGNQCRTSSDDGKSWSEPTPLFPDRADIKVSNERALVRTRDGTVILVFMNLAEQFFPWNKVKKDAPGAKLPTYAVRSLDGGKTWRDLQKLVDDYTGAVRDIIQTRKGTVVVTTMAMAHDPGRHTVLTCVTKDNGKTWKRSHVIDLGGVGHHGGVTEPSVEQLQDGRLWLLIRTNWGRFWEAFSEDEGLSWRTINPSSIEASSAPGVVKRLASGRLMLLWNRPLPEGEKSFPLSGGDGQWSEVPVSNHRSELSVAFSSDDGKTWTKPAVLARVDRKQWVAYPYFFEVTPGTVWVTTMQGGARFAFREADFIER